MKKILLTFSFLWTVSLAYCQPKQASHWFFGYKAGLDFSSGNPVTDTNSKLESIEGSCSISDDNGALLFYSNGEKVWDRNNNLMPNGTGLLGNQSSVQSSLIIPSPGNSQQYYLFTTSVANNTRYNIIDLRLNGGVGDVSASKNMPLFPSGTEDIAGMLHCNATDYWVLARQNAAASINFFCYKIDATGIGSPVISQFNISNPSAVGSLTFSQDGHTVAYTSFFAPIYLFNFDKATGQLTFRDSIRRNTNEYMYGNALSPDGQKLYVTSWTIHDYCRLMQFDLTAPNIAATKTTLDSVSYINGSPNGYGFIGQVRLAPDQKIYVSRWRQNNPKVTNPDTYYALDSLDVIQLPDNAGTACNFQRNYLYLNHRPTMIGLPNFVNSFTTQTKPEFNCKPQDIHDLLKEQGITLFPNPCETTSTLQSASLLKNASLAVYNMQGQVVKMVKSINGYRIQLSRDNLAAGNYMIRLLSGDGEVKVLKFVVVDR